MLTISDFKIGNNNQEILPMDTDAFPYVCNFAEMDSYIDKSFPWHWHSAFELDYVEEGELELRTANSCTLVKKGEAFFVNSNVMHDIRVKDRQPGCKIYAHIFDMHLLSGMYNSIYERKYLFPLLKSKSLQVYVIHPDSQRRIRIIEKILGLIDIAKEEKFGYEFEIRTELGRIWCMLLDETYNLRSQTTDQNPADIHRLKDMMQYIQKHYMEKLSLEEICSAANISSREGTRCFQRCIGISPVNYLNDYRIRMAAQMLLQTDDSIITISENCGFSTPSYFGKVFHEAMQCTPREYRKGTQKNSVSS